MKNLIVLLFIFTGCGKNIPQCPECKIYTGDSSIGAMVRAQDNEKIYADDPKFDQMKAFTDDGFKAFVNTYVNGCKTWKKGIKLNESVIKQNLPQLKKLVKKK